MNFDEHWQQKRSYYQGHKQTIQMVLEDLPNDDDPIVKREHLLLAIMASMMVDIAQSLAWIADTTDVSV